MPEFNEDDYALASDGLPARRNGRYAEEKLRFLDDYLPPALAATQRMQRRHVIDLFAGPGLNVDKHNVQFEFPGSPYRELHAHAPGHPRQGFSHAHLVNLSQFDHQTLTTRVNRWCEEGQSAVTRSRITLYNEAASTALPRILQTIPVRDYIFAFVDIQGITELPWAVLEEFSRHAHRSVDLYLLFPLSMTLQRLLAYDVAKRERFDPILTSFFGSDEWISLAEAPRTDAQSASFRQQITDFYKARLGTLWTDVQEQRSVRLTENRELYRMIFATNHWAAGNIAGWERDDRRSAQTSFDF